jgi:hypothetical protein
MPDFAGLLTKYMRRIRAAANDVAVEIGLSRQAIGAWKDGTAMPNKNNYGKVVACVEFLRLTEEETYKLLKAAGFSKFARLLNKYMRRMRATNSWLENQVGFSNETINDWKYDIAMPDRNHRDKVVACAQFLRLTEPETNEFLEAAGFEKEYVMSEDLAGALFVKFIQELFSNLLHRNPPVMLLLTQANWGEPPFREALLTQARKIYLPNNVLHVQPPYSSSTQENDYFSDLGRQCGFDNITDEYSFERTLQERLENSERLFLLVSRFEQGVESLRKKFAGFLRSLSERNANRLHVILCGGEKLAELKFHQNPEMSLLNIAMVEHLPELGRSEVYALRDYRFEGLSLDDELVDKLLIISGGHPQLLNECLRLQQESDLRLEQYSEELSQRNFVWQLFTPFTQNQSERQQVLDWLQQEQDLGKAQPFILDKLKRKLFWKNLLVEREVGGERRLCWRCEALRMAGQQILSSSSP